MIGHASSDERGKYSGGQAGDQNGREVYIREWYNRPWNVVMWAKDANVREAMAKAMEQACANDHIGYDQGQRTTLYDALRKVGFKMDKVKTDCETDCSALVACCANCAGIMISKDIYTGNEKSAFKQTGEFEIHTEPKYLTSDKYIPRGAILLYEGHHTAINLTNGSQWADESFTGWVTSGTCTWINVIMLWFLFPKVVALYKDYMAQKKAKKDPRFDPDKTECDWRGVDKSIWRSALHE